MKVLVVGDDVAARNQKTARMLRLCGHDALFRNSETFMKKGFSVSVKNVVFGVGRDYVVDGFDILIAYPRTEFLDTSVEESMGVTKNGNLSAWGRLSKFGTLKESEILEKRLNDLWFFSYLWDTDIPKICIVSDRIPKWGDKKWGVKPTQKIGTTYLWLKGLPKLKVVGNIKQAMIEQWMDEQWMGGVKW